MRKQTVFLNLTKTVQVEVLGDYVHDNDLSDCEFNLSNVKQTGGALFELLDYFDNCKESTIIELQAKAAEQLHRERIESRNEILKP